MPVVHPDILTRLLKLVPETLSLHRADKGAALCELLSPASNPRHATCRCHGRLQSSMAIIASPCAAQYWADQGQAKLSAAYPCLQVSLATTSRVVLMRQCQIASCTTASHHCVAPWQLDPLPAVQP